MKHLGTIIRLLIGAILIFCLSANALAQERETVVPVDPQKIDAEFTNERDVGLNNHPSVLLRLGQQHFDPLEILPMVSPLLNKIETFSPGEVGYYIVQFDGPIQNSWKAALAGLGADLFDYLPDFAFIMRMPADLEQAVRSHPHVRWLGIYQPAYRISQRVLDKAALNETDVTEAGIPDINIMVSVFPGEDLNRISGTIEALGCDILDAVSSNRKTVLKVKIPTDKMAEIPAISGVRWVEPEPEWELHNNRSTDVMNVRTGWDSHGLFGFGQTVAVCDTGIDQGTTVPGNLHDDFEDGFGSSRINQIFDRVGDGANDVNTGHGTHVAGSVLGNGTMSGSNPSLDDFPSTCFAGIAPQANLVFQAVEDNSTEELSGLPLVLEDLFLQADDAGADLHTNSWGASSAGYYTTFSEDVDAYMWDHPEFLILFSAGNSGSDLDADGVIDYYNVGSPGTAKNCLTVGASEGDRIIGAGYDVPWGTGSWALEYSVEPIFSDHVSDNPDGMAAFSSRGPVLDGRYKPDLVAPGTNILSVRSSQASGSGWGSYNSDYMWMGGTSMSTPLTAGASALMRQYLIEEKGFATPSAALIKASLLNSAMDMSPGQYGTGAAREIPEGVPNDVEGWGRLNLADGIFPAAPFDILYVDETDGLSTGEFEEYEISVTDPGEALKINLVWTDYPGSPVSQSGLVNDLDLQITDPSSTVYFPDQALQKSAVHPLNYNDRFIEYNYNNDRLAVRFTPTSYPVNLESATFYFINSNNSTNDVDVVVYDDDEPGGMPGGTELLRKTLTYVPTGWNTISISGVSITSGDFFISIEKNDPNQKLVQDDTGFGRSYHYGPSGWALDAGYTTYITANLRGADYSTSYDRVNNVVGLSIDNPPVGIFTVLVSGYNVPNGPQPYALVVSGNCATGGDDPPVIENIDIDACISECPTCWYSHIVVTSHDPAGGNLSYAWTVLNGGDVFGAGATADFDPPDSGPHPCPYNVQLQVTSSVSGLTTTQIVPVTVKLTGDVDGNGVVNILDKVAVRNAFGSAGPQPADVNCDNVVNILDKVVVRNQFGLSGCACE